MAWRELHHEAGVLDKDSAFARRHFVAGASSTN